MFDDFDNEDDIGDELERNLGDFFSGIGKKRTVLSGTWRKWMNEECGNGWECLAAWDNEDGLIEFTMKDPDDFEQVHAVYKTQIDRVHAVRTFAAIRYLYDNPREKLLKEGHSITPDNIANPNLYDELFCIGYDGDELIAEYEALGGEYQ